VFLKKPLVAKEKADSKLTKAQVIRNKNYK
jgi:hypothetical protein